MVIDTSALASVLFAEDDRETFLDLLLTNEPKKISAATLVEAGTLCLRDRSGRLQAALDRLLSRANIQVVSFDKAQAELAREAYRRFGKGHHPARLNLGDTFSYALAMHLNAPLLFKGGDFAQTDVVPAV